MSDFLCWVMNGDCLGTSAEICDCGSELEVLRVVGMLGSLHFQCVEELGRAF